MKTTYHYPLSIISCQLLFGLLPATALHAMEMPDTAKIYPLGGVEVKASVPSPFNAGAPLQVMSSGVLSKTGALQVADAVKFFSGVQVRDYGGIGGLKTISIRSLSANYSGLLYDGVPVFDLQTGQVDLGRFSLDNVLSLALQTGETGDLLRPAYERGFAATLSIITPGRWENAEKKNELKANFRTGSFGLLNPSFFTGRRLNNTFSLRFSGEYIQSGGNYPFTMTYGLSDSTAPLKRKNSDVQLCKLEANICGNFPNGGLLSGKAYYYRSDMGIPGAAIYYNDYSGERVKDKTAFVQASYTQHLRPDVDFRTSAKCNFSTFDYTDFIYNENSEMRGCQRQYFLSATVRYRISEHLSASWANDAVYGNFEKNIPPPSEEESSFHARMTYLSALTGQYEHPVFILTGSLLHNLTDNRSHWSPYLGLSVKPAENIPVRIRAYYKNTFRFPTLGDLYLSPVPALNLQPENAGQYSLGLTFTASPDRQGHIPAFSLSGDIYRINVENKLVALPVKSMFIWSVRNFGRTETRGFDLNLKMQVQLRSGFSAELSGAYTCQEVLDKTGEPRRQAYTPRHSATACLLMETPWLDANYTFVYCGKRNYTDIDRPEYQLKPYTDQGFNLRKTIRRQGCLLVFTAECLNMFDTQYEIVRSYPMPGRSFRLGMNFIY
jgi:outer membrane cobalamin receptor